MGEKVIATMDMPALLAKIERLRISRDFYRRRCEALQSAQGKMRDPERKAVCDILANGSTQAMNVGAKP